MLMRESYIIEIEDRLSWLETTVKRRNSMNLFDVDIHIESFFCELLNLVFGYNLENLNNSKRNYISIDLGDRKNKIAVQVTAQNTREKVQETINKFQSNEYDNEYERLIILIIGTKQKFKKPFTTSNGFCFDANTDIWDMNHLINEIKGKSDDELSQICAFFVRKMYPNGGYVGLSLEKLYMNFYSTCKAKLMTIGINEEIADRIIVSDIDSDKYKYILEKIADGKQYLIGEFGSGKSHALLVLSLRLMKEYIEGKTKVLPLYVQGKEIARIGSIRQWIRDSQFDKSEYILFVDGLDEIDYNFVGQLIEEINVLTLQNPQNKILVASRSLAILNLVEERKLSICPFTDRECWDLYNIVSESDGGEQAFRWISENMKKTLAKPFFCIIFALFKSESKGWAKQDIDLIFALVTKSIQKIGQNVESAAIDLARIAAKAVDRNYADIHISEINFSSSIESVLETGLVSFANDYISFPLPIIAQWMAAKAIRCGIVSIDDIISNKYRMDKWMYTLSILFSQMSFEESLDFFSKIAYASPGTASRIIRDGIRFDEMISLPPAYECGEKLRQTMQIWSDALGPLSEWIAPLNKYGIRPIGVDVQNGWITYSWLRTEEKNQPVQVMSFDEMQKRIGCIHSRGVPAQATWPWIITFEYLSDNLKKAVQGHTIIVKEGQLEKEYLWGSLLRISGKSSLYEGKLELKNFDGYRQFIGSRLIVNGKTVQADSIFCLIDKLISKGITSITAPYPITDKENKSGWIWGGYSAEKFLEKTQFIYGSAVNEYMRMADTVFSKLRDNLIGATLAPYKLVGRIKFYENSTTFGEAPQFMWYREALPYNEANCVDIQFGDTNVSNDIFESLIRNNLRLRPAAKGERISCITLEYLDICKSTPVTDVVFSWLERELKGTGWI